VVFASRTEAGRRLGGLLRDRNVAADVVVGLPRGGVVVAAAVAGMLQLPLDVLVVRKIGHPRHREFAVGAIAEGGVILLDDEAVGRDPLVRRELEGILAEETERLRVYQNLFQRGGAPTLTGNNVLLVDDGLATGATMLAAATSARRQHARKVIVAVPVASPSAVERLDRMADNVIALHVDPDFDAVGAFYDDFGQTTEAEVLALLRAGDKLPP
jgi:putative phosphoribosyl transferase